MKSRRVCQGPAAGLLPEGVAAREPVDDVPAERQGAGVEAQADDEGEDRARAEVAGAEEVGPVEVVKARVFGKNLSFASVRPASTVQTVYSGRVNTTRRRG